MIGIRVLEETMKSLSALTFLAYASAPCEAATVPGAAPDCLGTEVTFAAFSPCMVDHLLFTGLTFQVVQAVGVQPPTAADFTISITPGALITIRSDIELAGAGLLVVKWGLIVDPHPSPTGIIGYLDDYELTGTASVSAEVTATCLTDSPGCSAGSFSSLSLFANSTSSQLTDSITYAAPVSDLLLEGSFTWSPASTAALRQVSLQVVDENVAPPVPEPGTLGLTGLSILGLALARGRLREAGVKFSRPQASGIREPL